MLPLALAERGLIHEYELVVHPTLARRGPMLFAALSQYVALPVSRREFGGGMVATPYVPVGVDTS